MNNTREATAARIQRLCEEKNLSVNRLSYLSAVPRTTIRCILDGKSENPGVVTIKKLCDGFGISLIDFFDCPEFQSLEQEIK